MNDKVGAELFNYFDRFARKNKALVTQFMNRFYHKSYYKKHVLDFGSGTGCLCFQLVNHCESITGLDVDKVLYEYSVQRLSYRSKTEQKKVNFINNSIEQLDPK